MKKYLILAAGAAALILQGRRLYTAHYEIHNPKLKKRLKIVLLTDLHSHSHGKEQHRLVKAIEAENPDFILLGGDIADHRVPHRNTKILLKKLRNYPCFYVAGNHEFKSGEIDVIKGFFRKYGVRVLSGEGVRINRAGTEFNLCGVDDAVIGKKEYKKQLDHAVGEVNMKLFTILLAHRPEKTELYKRYGFDLILTGHAHGGQVRFPVRIKGDSENGKKILPRFKMRGVYAVHQGFFPEYTGGLYPIGKGFMIVSRGLSKSTRGIPRLFNRPELVSITVKPCKNKGSIMVNKKLEKSI